MPSVLCEPDTNTGSIATGLPQCQMQVLRHGWSASDRIQVLDLTLMSSSTRSNRFRKSRTMRSVRLGSVASKDSPQ